MMEVKVPKIKVAEIFYSLQGEGRYLGTPSIFLRTFGCNFTCSGFSMPKGQLSTERFDVDPTKYSSYNELPLVHTGCDSYASWDPRFKDFSPMMTIPQIIDRFEELLPEKEFSRDKHLIITGGEPLLTWQKQYVELISEAVDRLDLSYLTFETNGTKMLNPGLFTLLHEWSNEFLDVTFSVSAKLPSSSGHSFAEAIKPEVVKQYTQIEDVYVYLKFVVGNEEDIKDVKTAQEMYLNAGVDVPVYLMPVGGTMESYSLTEKDVAELAKQNGFRFSPRIQIPLWKNAWGT